MSTPDHPFLFVTYIHTLFTGSHYDTWRRIMRLSLYYDFSLQGTNPAQKRLVTPLGSITSPTLFEQNGVGSFSTVRGTYGFLSLSVKTRKCNRLQMSLQQQHLASECWSGRSWNPRPPAQQTSALHTELTRRQFRWKNLCVKLWKWNEGQTNASVEGAA